MSDAADPYTAPSTDLRPVMSSGRDYATAFQPYTAKGFKALFWWGLGLVLSAIPLVMVVVVIGVIAVVAGGSRHAEPEITPAMILIMLPAILLAAGVFIAGFVLALIIQYQAWNMINKAGWPARTTPGKAVGFQFIPFFSLYWMFIAYHQLAKDLNAFNAKTGLTKRIVNETIAVIVPIAMLCSMIPFIGGLFGLAYMVCGIIWLQQVAWTCADMITAANGPLPSAVP